MKNATPCESGHGEVNARQGVRIANNANVRDPKSRGSHADFGRRSTTDFE